jgi:hypothetical protein
MLEGVTLEVWSGLRERATFKGNTKRRGMKKRLIKENKLWLLLFVFWTWYCLTSLNQDLVKLPRRNEIGCDVASSSSYFDVPFH